MTESQGTTIIARLDALVEVGKGQGMVAGDTRNESAMMNWLLLAVIFMLAVAVVVRRR